MINIAIDGPAGAGKSTVAKMVAKELGITYLDTGAMYRAVALKFYRLNIRMDDTDAIIAGLDGLYIDIRYKDGSQQIFLDGEDVSGQIRQHNMSGMASDISKIKEVRLLLVGIQQDIARSRDVIMDGRDIGTFVLPGAKFKFYLTANADVRARRRHEELLQKGQNAEYNQVLQEIIARDHNDSTRDFAPLKMAQDAVLIDSSNLSAADVCKYIVECVKGA